MFSWPALLLLLICFELAFGFLIFAIMLRVWLWWMATFATVVFAGLLYWKQKHGRRDWTRVVSLEVRNGKIAFLPSRTMRQGGYTASEAFFPDGARVECHVETGDRYFTEDHGQFLRKSLWIVAPNGTKQKLIDYADRVSLRRMAINLPNSGVPFRVIRTYDGQEGEHTEADVTADYTRIRSVLWKPKVFAVLVGTSGLWLGALAGALVHSGGYAIAIGVVGYGLTAVLTLGSNASKRAALVQIASIIPSYAGGYALMVILVWYVFKR